MRGLSHRAEKRRDFMEFTSDDAAYMYARACRAWYGVRAPRIVKDRIEELRRAGDHSGVKAWSQVAHQLAQLQSTKRSAVDQPRPRDDSRSRRVASARAWPRSASSPAAPAGRPVKG